MRLASVLLIGSACLAAGCASHSVSNVEAPPGFDATIEQDLGSFFKFDLDPNGLIYIGGQPSQEAVEQFAALDGRIVVNLKTDDEMAELPDYEQRVEEQGLEYLHLPTAESQLGTGSAEDFRAVMDQLPFPRGPMLVHCQGSGRALYAVAMDQVEAGNMSVAEAITWTRSARGGVDWAPGVAAIRSVGRQKALRERGQ